MSVLDEAFTLNDVTETARITDIGIPQISDHFMNFLCMTLQLEPGIQ